MLLVLTVSANHKVKIKDSEKIDKYERSEKNPEKYKNESDIKCSWNGP